MIAKHIVDYVKMPLSPKYLRTTFTFLAIYKGFTALAIMLVILVGLTCPNGTDNSVMGTKPKEHEHEMNCAHAQYTNEQDVWAYSTYTKNLALDKIDTNFMLYFGATAAIIYVLSCFGFIVGIMLNWEKFFIPWLVADSLSLLGIVIVMLIAACTDLPVEYFDKWEFLCICTIIVVFHLITWGLTRKYYRRLISLAQLCKATMVSNP